MMNGAKLLLTVSAFGLSAFLAPPASAKCPQHDKESACVRKCKAGVKHTAMKKTSTKAISYKKSVSACPTTTVHVIKQEFCPAPTLTAGLRWSESARAWNNEAQFADIDQAANPHYIPVNRVDFWYANPCDRFSRGGDENLTDMANFQKLQAVRSGMAQPRIQVVRETCAQPQRMVFTKSMVSSCPQPRAACAPKTIVRSQVIKCRQVRAACPQVQACPTVVRTSCPTKFYATRVSTCPQTFTVSRPACPTNACGFGGRVVRFDSAGYPITGEGQRIFQSSSFPSSGQMYYVDSKGRMRQW